LPNPATIGLPTQTLDVLPWAEDRGALIQKIKKGFADAESAYRKAAAERNTNIRVTAEESDLAGGTYGGEDERDPEEAAREA
jgi:hypothetical protein